ncbi:MAG: hypothetical protein ACTSR0_06330, partial [Candidatus Asgardarchaeia archaeon]
MVFLMEELDVRVRRVVNYPTLTEGASRSLLFTFKSKLLTGCFTQPLPPILTDSGATLYFLPSTFYLHTSPYGLSSLTAVARSIRYI